VYRGGKRALPVTVNNNNLNKIKPLPGGSRFAYYVSDNDRSGGKVIYIVDPKKPLTQRESNDDIIIGLLNLTLVKTYDAKEAAFIPRLWQVDTITVDEAYRGQGIARSLYGLALTTLRMTLLAGSSQTPDGRRMWKMLQSIPGVEMFGTTNETNPKKAKAILKAGGRPLGRNFYAFPVRSGRSEIKSGVKGINIYHDYIETGVNLIAKWTGR
jgi:GNAT superfamily N-acetyltransferase